MRIKRNRDKTDQPAESIEVANVWEGMSGEHGVRIRIEEGGYGALHIYVELGNIRYDPQRPTVVEINEA